MGNQTKGLRKVKGGVSIAGDARVPVEFADGKTRYIKYNLRAIGTLENCYPERDAEGKLTGNPATPIGRILSWIDPKVGMSWSLLENFMWVGLLYDNPDVEKDDLIDLLDPQKLGYYDEQIGEALKRGIGPQASSGEEGGDSGKKEQSTGAN